MVPVKEAILLMSKEEIRSFKLYAQKVRVSGRRKDIELFDAIRQMGEDYDEEAAYQQTYVPGSLNGFHRLKSRLLFQVNQSMVALNLEKNDTLKLYHFLSVIEFYFEKRHFELAHWFLRKAEKLTLSLNHFEALDIVLNGYIRLSQEVISIDPTEFIARRKQNREMLNKIHALDDVLAAAKHKISVTQNYGPGGSEVMAMLEEVVAEYALDELTAQSATLRFKLFDAISRIMLDRHEYAALEGYSIATFDGFEHDGLFNRNSHDMKLKMLTFIVNALHKNGKHQTSLEYAERMRVEMEAFNGLLKGKYAFFYYNASVINYFEVDIDKAIEVLEEMEQSKSLVEVPFFELFIQMNLALAWHDKGNYAKAIRYIVATQLLDGFKNAAHEIKVRIAAAELIIRYKLGQYDVVVQRVRQFKNDFGDILKMSEFQREKELVGIIHRMNEVIDPKTDNRVQKRLNIFFEIETDGEIRDAELINYDEFLMKFKRQEE